MHEVMHTLLVHMKNDLGFGFGFLCCVSKHFTAWVWVCFGRAHAHVYLASGAHR